MANSSLRNWLIWILKANFVIWVINALLLVLILLLGSTWGSIVSSAFFSKITLLETGITLIVGGAIAFSGSVSSTKTKEYIRKSDERWSPETLRKSEKRANKYLVLAGLLFLESLIVASLGV